jgi:hypothetical protein
MNSLTEAYSQDICFPSHQPSLLAYASKKSALGREISVLEGHKGSVISYFTSTLVTGYCRFGGIQKRLWDELSSLHAAKKIWYLIK